MLIIFLIGYVKLMLFTMHGLKFIRAPTCSWSWVYVISWYICLRFKPLLLPPRITVKRQLSWASIEQAATEVPQAAREMIVYWARQARKRVKRRRQGCSTVEGWWGSEIVMGVCTICAIMYPYATLCVCFFQILQVNRWNIKMQFWQAAFVVVKDCEACETNSEYLRYRPRFLQPTQFLPFLVQDHPLPTWLQFWRGRIGLRRGGQLGLLKIIQ